MKAVSCFSCISWLVFLSACSPTSRPEIRELMQTPIAPASDALFNAVVYTNGELASAPRTDAQWARLRAQAESLMAAGDALAALAPGENPDEWRRHSAALAESATQAARAIDGKSVDGLLEAGSRIYESCTGCHAAYAVRAD